MSLSRSVAEVLQERVRLEVEGIDRMYLNVYVPALQRAGGVASFFQFHLGNRFASSALMDPITKAFIAQMEQLRIPSHENYHSGLKKIIVPR